MINIISNKVFPKSGWNHIYASLLRKALCIAACARLTGRGAASPMIDNNQQPEQ